MLEGDMLEGQISFFKFEICRFNFESIVTGNEFDNGSKRRQQ
jgi:hypothetical protein